MSGTVAHVLSEIQTYLDDKRLIELKVNAEGGLWTESEKGEWRHHKVPALSLDYWRRLARAVAISTGQKFDERLPMLTAKLPGGHRLMLVLGPNVISPNGSGPGVVATIRLFRRGSRTLADFGLDADGAAAVIAAVKARENILVSGSTGSGKTTLTNILCDHMDDEAPIYVEDTEELVPRQKVRIHFLMSPATSETNFSYKDLLATMQRSTPQRIVLGELNVENVMLTLRFLTMGLDGLITTLHANSADDTIPSLAELIALNGLQRGNVEAFYRSRIGMVIHCQRYKDRRMISEIKRPARDGSALVWSNGHAS